MLTISDVHRSFEANHVLRGVNLEVQSGEIICLLGPSGCGKTTLLRVIAGLEQADSGDVRLNGESILPIPVHQRDFGLMFQDFALFPHMNVAQNVAFGLKMHGVSKGEQLKRVGDVLELVGLQGFEGRDVSQLSGGERQRVALARSLAPNPRLLMLDEPLGSLDASLRERLVVELRDIIQRVGLTAIYVTHDQQEAFAIADRVAIMNGGVIEQIGTPETVYRKPETVFVARFLGLTNIVPVLSYTADGVKTAIGEFPVNGQPKAILLHPDSLTLSPVDSSTPLRATITERTFQGEHYRFQFTVNDNQTLTLYLTVNHTTLPDVGDQLSLNINVGAAMPLRT
jgi:ABC-type Fe3+/spermidine/putrescine transport system ATPase subunit